MKSGLLDRRVTFQTQSVTQNGFGEDVPTWSNFQTMWADVIPIKGDEQVLANRKTERVDFRVRIRYLANVTHDMRVVYETKNYDIVSINELGRQEGWEIFIGLHRDMQ